MFEAIYDSCKVRALVTHYWPVLGIAFREKEEKRTVFVFKMNYCWSMRIRIYIQQDLIEIKKEKFM
jgi:hypothetical protein